MTAIRWSQVGLWSLLLFLPAPIVIVVAASFSEAGYIRFPPGALSLRWYVEFLTDARWMQGFATSLLLAAAGAVISSLAAFLAALVVTRRRSRFSSFFETAVLTPILFPHAALGVAMLALVSMFHVYGSFAGLLLAHCIMTLPYAYRPISVSLRKLDSAMEEASMSLGARPWETFWRVTFPLVRPGLITALLFSFILSFDEVTVTMFLVGPHVTTLPVQIYSFIQESGTPVVAAISTTLVLFTLLMVMLLERLVGLEFFVEPDGGRA
ncbi:ABC transporter permease [Oceanibaculum indicum]|uniref:Binding-protein-dependent transporter inner membrane component family protein 57 n=1 Tax=Oceanibaculum indicum P24 TaxID=1207063 RepID=K2JWJ1_9PROT|nr:ABC transporter permease [Oceanibaculum indicum]EKE78982.1 binding-protein-dependent transporter inner membrane component family protein 57 [Oceanibaculum indicum P24]